jgi:B-box zinc finger
MPLPCARCRMPLPAWELMNGDVAVCTRCGSANTVRAFPAALAPANAPARQELALDGEAACFDHPNKRAVAACQQCGRFVCRLCSVEFGARILCPSCVAAGSGIAKVANLQTSRTLYDSIALIAPLVTLPVWPFTLIASPGAMVFTVMKWSQPISLVRRARWRFVLAFLIGLAETGLWIWGIVYAVAAARAGK